METPRIDLVLLWHMHQPDYRDAVDGRFMLPWTYLHAIKDYSDMAAHVERHPGVRTVFNFVPVLLEQIEDYVRQFDEGRIRDPLLGLLQLADLDAIELDERALILDSAFASNHQTMLEPYPEYRRLLELFQLTSGTAREGERRSPRLEYLSGAFLADLLTWYHLAWIGETERRANPLFGQLMAKGSGYTHSERLHLYEAIGAILRGLLPRYRALAERGCIELTSTPHTHPIGPLLIDLACAHEAMPGAPLPTAAGYPGGVQRVRVQIAEALESHSGRFGEAPQGIWPGEGAVSDAFVAELARAGVRWTASSEAVLANSLGRSAGADGDDGRGWLYRPWVHPGATGLTLLFRDERLSDLIGFEYARWNGRDAAEHLVREVEAIARAAPDGETPTVLIALDGENAWEYYPYNGYYFLDELYSRLETHPWIRTRTVRELLDSGMARPGTLSRLVAGSWVMGTLSTWIGDREKNRAWDLLCEAKLAYDRALSEGRMSQEARAVAQRQLAACEGSDWFWWLGPHNPAAGVARFDRLFRHNLRRLYQLIGLPAPDTLDEPFSRGPDGGHHEAGGAMRRAHEPA